jgi:hypothetical protein
VSSPAGWIGQTNPGSGSLRNHRPWQRREGCGCCACGISTRHRPESGGRGLRSRPRVKRAVPPSRTSPCTTRARTQPSSQGVHPSFHASSGNAISPAAPANALSAARSRMRSSRGRRSTIRLTSLRRRAVTARTRARPAGVTVKAISRPLCRDVARRMKPFATNRSHNRVAVDGCTPRASASSDPPCFPRDANTTNARYCTSVTSSSTIASDRTTTPMSARDASSTASVTASMSLCSGDLVRALGIAAS